MTDAPERIWAEQSGYFKKNGIYYNSGRWNDDEEGGMTPFVRLDLHEAAVAAARAEGLRIGAEVAEAHFQRVHPHSPDDPKGDLVAQGYGNAAINIKLALLAAATAEASK